MAPDNENVGDTSMSEVFERLAAAISDRYRLERSLGEGGMATVFLARDLKHDREVAIELLRPELAQSITGERFLRAIAITMVTQCLPTRIV